VKGSCPPSWTPWAETGPDTTEQPASPLIRRNSNS
jgi:hypothetical protein